MTISLDDALQQFPNLSATDQAKWSKAYFDIYGENPTYDQLMQFYNGRCRLLRPCTRVAAGTVRRRWILRRSRLSRLSVCVRPRASSVWMLLSRL